MNSWHEDLVVNRLINMLIVGDFVTPRSPFILFNTPVVIVYQTSFWEFDL